MSLRRVFVVLAASCADEDNDKSTNNSSSRDLEKVTRLRLEKWTEGSSTETTGEIKTLIENMEVGIVEVFQVAYEKMLEDNIQELLPLPERVPDWHDGSKITFYPAHAIKV